MAGLQGKVVVITGATSGFGRETAVKFAAEGSKVVLAARRTDELRALAEQLGPDAVPVTADVTTEAGADAMIAAAVERFGGIDILINNAGYMSAAPTSDSPVSEVVRMMQVNVVGLLNVTGRAVPFLSESEGHVINIGSTAAHTARGMFAAYCGSKAAVHMISQSLRDEFATLGLRIRVSVVAPGSSPTPLRDGVAHPVAAAWFRSYVDSQEVMTPAQIADTVLWVASQPPHTEIVEVIVRPLPKRRGA